MTYINTYSKKLHLFLILPALSLLFLTGFYNLVWYPVHCSLVQCAEAKQSFTFDTSGNWLIRLPNRSIQPVKGFDLDKLAHAVARHETNNCQAKAGSALVRNCFGIRVRVKGKPQFKRYARKEDSYADFKRIWSTYYKRFPDTKLAVRYSGNDRPQEWLGNVTKFYNDL